MHKLCESTQLHYRDLEGLDTKSADFSICEGPKPIPRNNTVYTFHQASLTLIFTYYTIYSAYSFIVLLPSTRIKSSYKGWDYVCVIHCRNPGIYGTT